MVNKNEIQGNNLGQLLDCKNFLLYKHFLWTLHKMIRWINLKDLGNDPSSVPGSKILLLNLELTLVLPPFSPPSLHVWHH